MALRKILTQDDELLHKVCKPVETFDEKLGQLLDDMHETLDKAQGVGLAGPQVGVCRRLFIMHLDEDDVIEAINPQILKTKGKQRVMEGCLSCPDTWGYVRRPMKCVLKAQDRNGKWFERSFSELGAQCVCHENDHLDGHVFTEIVEEFVVPGDDE
ncbi:MAG: peptide deformylase [Ruminococcus sp.]|nr:peptide deformylase [Ruminococcus sp.]MBO5384185.1 peptide deformylase [Ruminococcus sp.]MBR6669522.1 peptide deformylase [Ruminococcus sp.]